MTLTVMDERAALVVIDLQKATVARTTEPPTAEVVQRSAELAKAFRDRGLPVVLVNVTGGAPGRTDATQAQAKAQTQTPKRPADWAELVPELDAHPDDLRVTKQTWGAFHGTSLHGDLQARGVTQVVLTGIATSIGVESTARAAHEHGYHVVLAVDAMSDLDPVTHRHSIERVFPRLGETATTAEILEVLTRVG
ncbi:isochorismatase family protein [Rhodococcus sp. D2-41]|uniref:Isochorismatase family protein n=1 Tax=Speluncibacter jeojiensis TaxID=2710754 RepID=A0A9X4LZK0_9ACTN|nr:isochorismatase family protein [Rhodococcus sp. D2-41]MDG3010392.1 isochorismatase family protein [Rhodococcus sp. D2-41]MDG3014129.1 isochorismatase family protein [Corynebacteriales bacterium D3-21]